MVEPILKENKGIDQESLLLKVKIDLSSFQLNTTIYGSGIKNVKQVFGLLKR